MVSEITDYRISRVVILCKDCGQDVGFYPARHKCGQTHLDAPPLPSIPKKYTSGKESEKDGHESETHISRILREYYEKKSGDLPNWLYDSTSTNDNDIGKTIFIIMQHLKVHQIYYKNH
ncbi:16006_t:CDS:2 [Entrophospora sp. SA101]|nr:8270_t:CDS:2 [Entrophospora candida]CAH1764196.1 5733_t:CDS:2 [Entrophospora sp. SA101]CAJ0630567.1 14644_t:CDS:2 [Entrophospora sp. SA101]CAJ0753354.1 16006_t:CDS:2 [Entrophospora sp. SA101]CAJ0836127.1 11135_t:CDS:2 [Entrophospora sp. SA101]